MKWFKHETNSGFNAKMKKLLMKYGVQGYGLYYYCVEIIAGNLTTENITFELEHDASILAYDLKMDTYLVEEIMLYCIKLELFELNEVTKRIVHTGLFNMLDNTMSQNSCIKKLKTSENFKNLQETLTRREENRIEKKRKEKNINNKNFKIPEFEEIQKYILENSYKVDAEKFFNYYQENNWKRKNGIKLKNWKLAVKTWNDNHNGWFPEKETNEQKWARLLDQEKSK